MKSLLLPAVGRQDRHLAGPGTCLVGGCDGSPSLHRHTVTLLGWGLRPTGRLGPAGRSGAGGLKLRFSLPQAPRGSSGPAPTPTLGYFTWASGRHGAWTPCRLQLLSRGLCTLQAASWKPASEPTWPPDTIDPSPVDPSPGPVAPSLALPQAASLSLAL